MGHPRGWRRADALVVRSHSRAAQPFRRGIAIVVLRGSVGIAQRRLLLVVASQSSAADVGRMVVDGAGISVIPGFGLLRAILVFGLILTALVANDPMLLLLFIVTNAGTVRSFRS
jgi:hypothetical protein